MTQRKKYKQHRTMGTNKFVNFNQANLYLKYLNFLLIMSEEAFCQCSLKEMH